MKKNYDRKIILANGDVYYGYGFGSMEDKVLEIVFNTSMAGYQEILSDPSYTDQAVVMTYPLIGNYGMCDDDYERDNLTIGAMLVREYNPEPSNYRSTASLGDIMKKFNIAGVSGLDTRKLTREIRDYGSQKILITGMDTTVETGLRIINETEILTGSVKRVSCTEVHTVHTDEELYHVVAVDCGMKENIVRRFGAHNCKVTIVPWNTPADEIKALDPDGIFLSNGPGDPEDVEETIETVRNLIGYKPIFGICLGHQLLSLAYGAHTYKLKFGHRGGNHPVKDLTTGKIEITSQNHSYAVDAASLEGTPLEVTHINILDGTVEGMRCIRDKVMCVQYHPESAPGPQDSDYLYDRFTEIMKENKSHA